ncbi:MAG: hypothetical protein IT379_12905 [Deltaproteobacteria bacterium]|nr:hypothetical protein [Deltaproteobacteria bacterium]
MRSVFLLGCDVDAERALEEPLGGDAARFFVLAQRAVWGMTQPDVVRANVDAALGALIRSHGGAFPAHLLAAWVWHDRDRSRADDALARARAMATPGHALAYLLPSDEAWRCVRPDQRLEEVVEGRMWRARHWLTMRGSTLLITSTATLVRTDGGDLLLVNPVALDGPTRDAIAALGPVRWIVTQGRAHSAHIDDARRAFPEATVLGTPGHLRHPPAAHVELDDVLGTYRGLPAELELLPIDGHVFREWLLVHRPTRTLIVQDLVGYGLPGDPATCVGRLYAFAFGLVHRIGLMSYSVAFWENLPALRDSLRRVRDTAFDQVVGAHWPIEPRRGDEVRAFREALELPLGLRRIDHVSLAARYFWSQPGFLVDLLRYQRASSKVNAGARLRKR